MSDEHNLQVDERDRITLAERRNIWIWAIILLVIFAVTAVVTAGVVYKNKIAAIERHGDRMNPDVGEGGTKPPPTAPPAGANPVRAGIYVDRIIDLSVKEARWTVDFYLWFPLERHGNRPRREIPDRGRVDRVKGEGRRADRRRRALRALQGGRPHY